MIECPFQTNNTKYTVLGIFDVDEKQSMYNKYKSLHDKISDEKLYEDYLSAADSILTRLVVSEEFFENFKQSIRYLQIKAVSQDVLNEDCSINCIMNSTSIDLSTKNMQIHYYGDGWNENTFDEKIKSMKKNEVIVNKDVFRLLMRKDYKSSKLDEMKELIDQFNKGNKSLIIENIRSSATLPVETYQSIENIQIVAVVIRHPGINDDRYYLQNECYNDLLLN